MTKRKAKQMLDEMKKDYQFCVTDERGRVWTAQELWTIVSGREVTYEDAIDYLLSPAKA